jgi:hypothetical protein
MEVAMTATTSEPCASCGRTSPSPFAAPPPRTEDPARHVGEVFRRLTLAAETFGLQAFDRIVVAMLQALGRAVLEEAERDARMRRERETARGSDVRLGNPGRVDFDGFDIAEVD